MMTSVKMWCFLLFAAFMLIVPTVTEVVDSVSDCAEFLLNKSPPQMPGILQSGNIVNQNRYKVICQTFRDQRRFLTLYDTKNKIPVFSAYKYKGEQDTGGQRPRWRIEPELEERNTNNMRDEEYTNQAINKDYTTDRRYNKGHLFPVCHAYDHNDRNSTFTLTNSVPQAVSFNGGSWQKMESCTKCILKEFCINNNGIPEGFVVTGAQPSMNNKLNNRVNIPSVLWTAFCCYSRNINRWIASAHWGDNTVKPKSKYLQTKTLAELHQELKTMSSRFDVFPGTQCPLHTTVAEFYPEMKSYCQCPPQASTTTGPPTTTTLRTATTTASSQTQSTMIPPTTTTITVPTTTVKTTSSTTATTTTTTKNKNKEENNSDNDEDNGQEGNQDQPGGNNGAPSGGTGGSGGLIGGIAGILGGILGGVLGGAGALGGALGGISTGGGGTAAPVASSTTFILATIDPKTNATSQTLTTSIPPTSDPQTNSTSETSTTFHSTTINYQTNTTSHVSRSFNSATTDHQANTASQTSTTFSATTIKSQTKAPDTQSFQSGSFVPLFPLAFPCDKLLACCCAFRPAMEIITGPSPYLCHQESEICCTAVQGSYSGTLGCHLTAYTGSRLHDRCLILCSQIKVI